MKLDQYGNCEACGPEGCKTPQNHYKAALEDVLKLSKDNNLFDKFYMASLRGVIHILNKKY